MIRFSSQRVQLGMGVNPVLYGAGILFEIARGYARWKDQVLLEFLSGLFVPRDLGCLQLWLEVSSKYYVTYRYYIVNC